MPFDWPSKLPDPFTPTCQEAVYGAVAGATGDVLEPKPLQVTEFAPLAKLLEKLGVHVQPASGGPVNFGNESGTGVPAIACIQRAGVVDDSLCTI